MRIAIPARLCTLFAGAAATLLACSSTTTSPSDTANAGTSPSTSGSGGSAVANSGGAGAVGSSGTGATQAAGSGGAIAAAGSGAAGASAGRTGADSGGAAGTSGGGAAGVGTAAAGSAGAAGSGSTSGPPPAFSGPVTAGTVTVTRGTTKGHLGPAFAGLSFEKTHMSDNFFSPNNAPLIALFKLLGPSSIRIGANDVDACTWVPTATPVAGGKTSTQIGTVEVDALTGFLAATGWKAIYGVSMRTATAPSVAEASYAFSKLGASLDSLEIGNEINFFAGNPTQTWETFEAPIHAATPTLPLAGPAAAGDASGFVVPFANAEGKKLVLLTDHYYIGAASSNPTIANMLKLDPNVVTYSQTLANAAKTNNVARGFRWGEMNSYSGHGAAGVSDVYASALWGIDFMLTTAGNGAAGVNFHGGGQNMDGNSCSGDASTCTKPFKYSPIDEVNSQVTAAAPLFYGMLLVSQAGTGDMLQTRASAGNLNFTAYSIQLGDGSTNVVLVNKDATNGVNASVDLGAPVSAATGVYLQAPALTSTTGVTFSGAGITAAGAWSPKPPYSLSASGNQVTVVVPPATAILVHAR